MGEKFLLSDEELSSVVGGLASDEEIQEAFNLATHRLEKLYDKLNGTESECEKIVHRMLNVCYQTTKPCVSESEIKVMIDHLEHYYLEFLCLQEPRIAYTTKEARETIDHLKRNIDF